MGNDKTSVLALFPEVNHKTISFEKYTAYLHAIVQTKKKRYSSPNPNLKLNPNCNPSSD